MSNTAEQISGKECELVFFLTKDRKPATRGTLYVKKETLFIEFDSTQKKLSIPRATAPKLVEFADDNTIQVECPDQLKAPLRIFPDQSGQGRFQYYALRSWVHADQTSGVALTKQKFLRVFDSFGAKICAIFQLALPFLIYYAAFWLRDTFASFPEEISVFLIAWHSIVFSPLVASHYLIFTIPVISAVFFSRARSLTTLLWLSVIIAALLVVAYWFPISTLPAVDLLKSDAIAEQPLLAIPAYFLITLPYAILLLLPTLYYIVILRRL